MIDPRVAIVVLNWNNWWDTLECLASLYNLEFRNHSIWIVDNGSRNDSLKHILNWLEQRGCQALVVNEKEVKDEECASRFGAISESPGGKYLVIRLEENRGYAGGNNAALRLVCGLGYDYAWLLNNDTIVSADALQELVDSAEREGRVGMVVSNLVNVIENKTVYDKKHYFQDLQMEVNSLAGGSILVKILCLSDIGLIDEKYFCYGEELDWSLRARRNGWRLIRNFRSVVFHKWGGSTQSQRVEKRFLWKKVIRIAWKGFLIPGYYESRNGIYFMKKNHRSLWIPYAVLRTIHLILQSVLYDDRKWGRVRIILKGARDGFLNRMGKADISI